ncbi:MAG: DMT family transporter [Anaerolineae bacterium]|nr:MAG: DMT family transporter [Anaerolineae bacterium]
MPEQRQRLLIPLALFIAILAVSTASIFIRFAQRDAPSLVIAAYRLTLATLLLAPIALTRRRAELRALTRRELGLALLSGFFLAMHFASWTTSLEYTTVAASVVLVDSSPLWVALLSPLLLRERVTRYIVIGMVLAFFGGALIGLSDACTWSADGLVCAPFARFVQGRAFWGDFLALVGAWAVTGYLLIGRRLRAKMSLVTYIFLVYGMAAVVLVLIVLAMGAPLFGYPPMAYLWLFLLALVPQLIGHSTYNWALRFLPAAFVAVTTLGEPIGSTILAYFLLDETPALLTLLGGALILAGIYIASKRVDAAPGGSQGT